MGIYPVIIEFRPEYFSVKQFIHGYAGAGHPNLRNMISAIFVSMMVLHGLLHLIGFSKELYLGTHGRLTIKTLSGNTSWVLGTLWLLAFLLFIAGSLLYLLRKEWFWIPTAAGLLLSQTLIIINWQDAWYGTVVNILILIAVVFLASMLRFNSMVKKEVEALQANARAPEKILTEGDISGLPKNVQRWLRQSNAVGKKVKGVIRVHQRGSMRSKPGGKWMPLQAIQYFSIDPPSFVWDAKIKAAPLIEIAGRDKYQNGSGHMLIKPLYVFTAASSSGEEINQGSLLRYLAEIAWFPQAAVSDYLEWKEISKRQAEVTMTYGGITASGTYFFNEDGNIAGFEAQRYGAFEGIYRKETWSITVTSYKAFNDIIIGNKSEVTWKLKEGDFHWLKLEVTEIQ